MESLNTTLGELITSLYGEYISLYNDEEAAALATARTINALLADGTHDLEAEPPPRQESAA
ncbi:MAG: hypothetical protein JXX28_12270 [Deltaproteobacteria bacterium]|nr:hypothetical protein [Deltaproteobacteria bacterium]